MEGGRRKYGNETAYGYMAELQVEQLNTDKYGHTSW